MPPYQPALSQFAYTLEFQHTLIKYQSIVKYGFIFFGTFLAVIQYRIAENETKNRLFSNNMNGDFTAGLLGLRHVLLNKGATIQLLKGYDVVIKALCDWRARDESANCCRNGDSPR